MDGALDLSSKGNPPSRAFTPESEVGSPMSDQDKEDIKEITDDQRKDTPSSSSSSSEKHSPSPTNIIHPVFGQLPPFQFPPGFANFMDMTKVGANKNKVNSLPGVQPTPPGLNMFPIEPSVAATAAMYNPMAAAAAMGMAGLGFPYPLNPVGGLPLPQTIHGTCRTPSPMSNIVQRKRKRSRHSDLPGTLDSGNTGQLHCKDINVTKPNDGLQNKTPVSEDRVSTSDVTNGSITNQETSDVCEMPSQVERRRKNNEAAKRSRDTRRLKEAEIAVRAAMLEEENLKLKAQVAVLKNETSKLHVMLYQM